ncbi:ornithine carbamoyltransferase [Priestia filamentosa]|uniref:Ornithine carbamoyltransferase n=1 Tax=Priestia filamentosa TaxID=1402861 RepID=A0A1X7FJT3_9BACI|nr:ornithine carbamoyltransferase [Priestia filamentosa]AKO91300.1 ornithine carbamoyltransferase [Priestia filamentosa]MDT3765409.1 ornithine carbamoyltransferase [Priestia filamentosa]OXS67175.1 ornithine carbamoyltransferase [Priestia filamentosa]RJS65324.1 ornithine carbamoyltransferase [Priestia filamentosa]WCM16470.1 ornithine carbamoyltransferase [Priestia filamentosa]
MNSLQANEVNVKGKSLLTLLDWSKEEIEAVLQKGVELKKERKEGELNTSLNGQTLGLIFEKSSTRTRVSFEAGMMQLGGNALYLNGQDLQIGRGESIHDTAKVLSEFIDAIMIRTFEHSKVEELAKYGSIPVINGLTDEFHPCQALADLMTIYEEKGTLKGLKVAYIGDGNNVAHSLMIACAKVGAHFSIACPKGYEPKEWIVNEARKIAEQQDANINIVENPVEAVQDSDAVYTDVWTSMGQEAENDIRLKAFSNYQVNDELVKHAKDDYLFLHCLPAHREEEVTASVIDGDNSYVFQQAGNRMHVQKALLQLILG